MCRAIIRICIQYSNFAKKMSGGFYSFWLACHWKVHSWTRWPNSSCLRSPLHPPLSPNTSAPHNSCIQKHHTYNIHVHQLKNAWSMHTKWVGRDLSTADGLRQTVQERRRRDDGHIYSLNVHTGEYCQSILRPKSSLQILSSNTCIYAGLFFQGLKGSLNHSVSAATETGSISGQSQSLPNCATYYLLVEMRSKG